MHHYTSTSPSNIGRHAQRAHREGRGRKSEAGGADQDAEHGDRGDRRRHEGGDGPAHQGEDGVRGLVERFDRRGTEPFEFFRSEFGQNSGNLFRIHQN